MSTDQAPHRAVIDACRELNRLGLSHGSSGNVSVRHGTGFLISPTGRAYEALEPRDIPSVGFDGRWVGHCRPSSEWRFHRDILAARAEVGAIVHAHPRFATALACTGRGIPAFHYMVAVAGGADIRCAPYHTFGSQALSDAALAALADRRACLLAHHGIIAVGADVGAALRLAAEVENLAAQYCTALAVGGVSVLSEGQMREVLEKFRTYGRPEAVDPDLHHAGDGS